MNDSNIQNKKDRNQKRIRDKYKKKKPSIELDKKKADNKAAAEEEKSRVPNNWDRYEEKIEEHEDIQMDATNFKTLSSNMNERNFFQFKHEKKWLEEIKQSSSDQTPNDYSGSFHLNLNLLKAAIGSIQMPFRCNIPSNIFTEKELEAFDDDTEVYAEQYQKLVKHVEAISDSSQNPRNPPNPCNLNLDVDYPKSTASSKLLTLVDSVGTSERAVPIKRSKTNESNICSADNPKSQDDYLLCVSNLDKLIVKLDDEKAAQTNKVEVKDSDSDDDELDFLLSLPKSKAEVQDKNTQPIECTEVSCDVDMDVLDSLLS